MALCLTHKFHPLAALLSVCVNGDVVLILLVYTDLFFVALRLIAHHSQKVAICTATLKNKDTFLAEVELVWFGKDEQFSFHV